MGKRKQKSKKSNGVTRRQFLGLVKDITFLAGALGSAVNLFPQRAVAPPSTTTAVPASRSTVHHLYLGDTITLSERVSVKIGDPRIATRVVATGIVTK